MLIINISEKRLCMCADETTRKYFETVLEEIRKEILGFMPPQMYFVLDKHKKLKELLEKQLLYKKRFIHLHNEIYYDNLAMLVSELEKLGEFKKIDSNYQERNSLDNMKYN